LTALTALTTFWMTINQQATSAAVQSCLNLHATPAVGSAILEP
jgi:hypothetical protein